MQSQNEHVKKRLVHLIIFALLVVGILIASLVVFQKTVEKHYTTHRLSTPEPIQLYKSSDEEHKFVSTRGGLHSTYISMIPNTLIEQ